MKKKRVLLIFLLALIVFFFLGPSPSAPEFSFTLDSNFPQNISQVEEYVNAEESQYNIRQDNQSRFNWANPDSITKTEYAIVYLHGFSASPGEGIPIHTEIAADFNMNLYIPRLAAHGLETDEALLDFKASEFMESAYRAIKIGELIGEKVIVVSCSTGGTASLFTLAETDVNVHAQVLYSPNIKLADPKTSLLTIPWGLQIARLVSGGDYHVWDVPEGAEKYWYGKYRLESVVELQNMLNHTMLPKNFSKITVPTMLSYFYRDESNQDDVVSVTAMKEMRSHLSTPTNKLYEHAFENADAHALQSKFFSKDLEAVYAQTERFFTEVLDIKKPL